MTLENCRILLEHYEKLADGRIEKPVGHVNWEDVKANAKVRAEEMRARIERKLKHPKYRNLPGEKEEPKKEKPKEKPKEEVKKKL